MPTKRVVLIGAGGHGRVVYEAWQLTCSDIDIYVRDDNPLLRKLLGAPVKYPAIPDDTAGIIAHVAIGHNDSRKQMGIALMAAGSKLETVMHPDASVSRYAEIDNAVFVGAQATLAPGALIQCGVIINHGAIVDHDCQVGPWSHIAPRAVLGGSVSIGEGVLIGSGAVILSGLSIADHAIVGAGAVVTRDIPENECWVGVPARNIR